MMNGTFVDPISLSFQLLESYRALLDQTLADDVLSDSNRATILSNIEVDRGLYFSLNRKYRKGQTGFRQFCRDQHMAHRLPDLLAPITQLYIHQEKAIEAIASGHNTIISTGTGSGKTESFLIPILDYCLKHPVSGIQALIIYPMNALAGDQLNRLAEYTAETATSSDPITFGSYTGATPQYYRAQDGVQRLGTHHKVYRNEILSDPPRILVTNYVMLDWLLTDPDTAQMFTTSADSLRFIVVDELHSYRGNKATHLKYLLRRLKALLNNETVQIGTSATLADPKLGSGYLGLSSGAQIEDFIKPLFDVDNYEFIIPEYEPEIIPDTVFPVRTDLPHGWRFTPDIEAGRKLLEALTGCPIRESVLTDPQRLRQSDTYRVLASDAFISALRQMLITDGAQSLNDLVRLYNQLLPVGTTVSQPEEVVKAYLSTIAFVNHYANPPLLDFRIHLFVREIGGSLKRCIRCRKYHSGGQEACTNCGYPLFYVYRQDINCCIGKISLNRLKPELRRESDDQKNTYYVRIAFAEQDSLIPTDHAPRFDLGDDPGVVRDELPIHYDQNGTLQLTRLNARRYDDIEDDLVQLVDGTKDYQYLHRLVKTLLDAYLGDKLTRKCLGFIDNREKASRLSSVLRDEFAAEFFESFLQLHYPPDAEWNINDILDRARSAIVDLTETEGLSALEKQLFDEFEIWYRRWIGLPKRYAQSIGHLLKLKYPERFTPDEHALLAVFIDERAIAHEFNDDRPDSRFIRFEKHWATDHRAIRLDGKDADDLRHPSIVLVDPEKLNLKSAQNTVYFDFVRQYGIDSIRMTIAGLVQRGVLHADNDLARPGYYYLSSEQVCIDSEVLNERVGTNRVDSYNNLRARLLVNAELHSSEVDSAQRAITEASFERGDVQFLLATPTLEMGIDIGKLQNVLLIGVPPLPSNYAQRAGRAGRGNGHNYALIVTLCAEDNNHDIYYFADPRQMINGVISPPTFNPTNAQVIRRHINAFALSPFLRDRHSLDHFWRNFDRDMVNQIPWLQHVFFGTKFDVQAYLATEFKTDLNHILGKLRVRKGNVRQYLYTSGFFPDYSFRKDGVSLIDENNLKKLQQDDDAAPRVLDIADYALSTLEPEMAYYKFVPGETMYIGGEIYTILSEGDYDQSTSQTACGVPIRGYRYIAARKQIRFANKSKMYNRYDLTVSFDGNENPIEKQKVLRISFSLNCHLQLINCGIKRNSSVEPFDVKKDSYAIGYSLTPRQALILEFATDICDDERYTLSLASCLDRAIKDKYGLDESEVRLLAPDAATAGAWRPVILYDFDGNGNVPLSQVFADFDELVRNAHDKMTTCACENGCYVCMRSYGTHHYAGSISKQAALMFTGYLLGLNRFVAVLPTIQSKGAIADLVLTAKVTGDTVNVHCGEHAYTDKWASGETTTSQNKALFQTMSSAIRGEFRERMKTLRIESPLAYLVEAIKTGAINKDVEAFSALQFELLRFSDVYAEKI